MLEFNIYPLSELKQFQKSDNLYIKVMVFGDREAMYDFYRDNFSGHEENFGAITCPTPTTYIYQKDQTVEVKDSKICDILFAPTTVENKVGGSVVIHESVHAAFNVYGYLKLKFQYNDEDCDNEEENLAYLIQQIAYLINLKFYELEIW